MTRTDNQRQGLNFQIVQGQQLETKVAAQQTTLDQLQAWQLQVQERMLKADANTTGNTFGTAVNLTSIETAVQDQAIHPKDLLFDWAVELDLAGDQDGHAPLLEFGIGHRRQLTAAYVLRQRRVVLGRQGASNDWLSEFWAGSFGSVMVDLVDMVQLVQPFGGAATQRRPLKSSKQYRRNARVGFGGLSRRHARDLGRRSPHGYNAPVHT